MEFTSDSVVSKLQAFTDKLRDLRNQNGISAREMSLSLGQNVNYINLIENGKRKPSLDMFLYICEYLKVSPEYFFSPTQDQKPKLQSYHDKILNELSKSQKALLVKFILSLK
ncbi:MAG: helix-turn-helix domain-containing protein [Treponema sp.]|nr:helix-turn-helix domain-containing protein [Treponema sp.]